MPLDNIFPTSSDDIDEIVRLNPGFSRDDVIVHLEEIWDSADRQFALGKKMCEKLLSDTGWKFDELNIQ